MAIRILSRQRIDEFERDDGMHVSRIGYMRLASKPEQLERFRAALEYQRSFDIEHSVILEPDEIAKVAPDLEIGDVIGAMHNYGDGHIDGPLLCGVLVERARALGVQIRTNARIRHASRSSTGRHVVSTDSDSYEADIVINAAGAWATEVGEMLEAPLPLVNERHEVILVKLPRDLGYEMPMIQEYVPGEKDGVYFRQDSPGRLIGGIHSHSVLGVGRSEDPENYNRSVSWDTVKQAAVRISARLPIEGLGFNEGWAGLYPVSPDAQYVVGPYEHDASVLAFGGLAGAGLGSALGLGQVVADWAIHGESRRIPEATALLPSRASLKSANRAGE
jgi:glycine/D-amino acid oxidase-like deaminating enzyme